MKKIFLRNIFCLNFFFKIISRKKFGWKKNWENFFVKNYYACKLISSETVWMKKILRKFYCRKMFLVAKSFPRKHFGWKKKWRNFFVENFYGCKIISSETEWMKKIWSTIFLVEIFFLFAKSIPRNKFRLKIIWKIISRKFVWLKIFLVAKSFPQKQFGWK
jgi:hypothetical protein